MSKKELTEKLDSLENIDEIDNMDTENKKYKDQSEEEVQLQSDLQKFYKNHFDVKHLWRVIDRSTFQTREFGFNRLNGGFTRNKSFLEPEHLHEYLYTFPIIGAYIGSLYKNRLKPKDRYNKAVTIHNAEWWGRELIFDLDLDDYNPVRTCKCVGKDVCEDCWGLMQEAADIINDTLIEDFGFKKLEWVYTGGRGYHCWVLDKHTFSLNQEQRTALVDYMQYIHDPKGLQKVDKLGKYDDQMRNRVLVKLARKMILTETQKFLIENAGFTSTRYKNAKKVLEKSQLVRDIKDIIPKGKEGIFYEAVLKHHYPRIDHKVTIDIRRLIRMPGSIHIRSKNVSQYISNPTTFNPINDAINMYDILDS